MFSMILEQCVLPVHKYETYSRRIKDTFETFAVFDRERNVHVYDK